MYFSHRTVPVARSKQMTPRLCPLPVACTKKTRSPQTMGDEFPASGNDAFQRMFSLALHFNGGLASWEMPCPVGPRQAGQFSAWVKEEKQTKATNRSDRRMVIGESSAEQEE